MSTVYELTEEDDIREIQISLTRTNADDPEPESAVLILSKSGVRLEREMVEDSDGLWTYRFTDADFVDLVSGTWKGQVYATFEDGTNGTYPTGQPLTIKVHTRL